jgi:hypothetical protein
MGNVQPRRWHLPAIEPGVPRSLVAEEAHGTVVVYIGAVGNCAMPLTVRVRQWLRALLDELDA